MSDIECLLSEKNLGIFGDSFCLEKLKNSCGILLKKIHTRNWKKFFSVDLRYTLGPS